MIDYNQYLKSCFPIISQVVQELGGVKGSLLCRIWWEGDTCHMSLKNLGCATGLKVSTVSVNKTSLANDGYIKEVEKMAPMEAKNKLEHLPQQNERWRRGQACEWCKTKTIAIQAHHYPVQKSKGGTSIVSICPNCHYEFHALINGGHCTLTDKALKLIDRDLKTMRAEYNQPIGEANE